MQYGFQRLVLLGSAGYSRAELPLDGAVSLVAPNNTGKTSLINALQFLLIIDRRRMDFGAHDVDKSRRFYFPNNCAYVLLEVSMPESGTVVLGCVGKGVSFEYEHFSYAGQLKVEEFCLPEGTLVAQPQLASHLASHGRRVFSYSNSEFAAMVYGGRNRKLNGQQDFCVFRLEHANDASVFQSVLTRTLRLDKLRSSEVKDYLLQIFRRDLPDASIDFKAEWDKAFADLNAERSQYLAAIRLQASLGELEQKQDARLVLRGKLLCWRPLIDEALGQWQQHYEASQQSLQNELAQCDVELQHLREQDIQSAREQNQCEQEQEQLRQQSEQLRKLQQRFALIAERSVLEARRRELQEERDALVVRIDQAQRCAPAAIERELARIEQDLAQIAQEMRTQGQYLYQQLANLLPAAQLTVLNKVLAKPVLTLGAEDFRLDSHALAAALADADAGRLELPGLQLRLEALPLQHQQRTLAELGELQQELQQQQALLREQLGTALALENVKQQRLALEQELAQLEDELRDYTHMQTLQHSEAERQGRLEALAQKLAELTASLAQSGERHRALDQQRQQRQQDLAAWQQQHRQIEQRRNQRLDHEGPFTWLADLPHRPWLAQPQFALEQLAERLQTYLADCRQLLELDEQIRHLLGEIHVGGLTKYQFVGDAESEIERLVEFAHHLPQEAEALEKKARSAVVNVALCLRELRDGLLSFKRRMREFNRKISGRQLSDLAVFKIEPEDETALVEAIDLLINTAATVDSGETFELFNQQSVLDDDQLNRAKTLLIEEGNARHGLRVADLFRLRFWVGKADREPEAFDDLDSAASNGTVLMAKLVTGLAMLHLMQDQRRPIQGVCYLDEALALDARNQRSLIDTAAEFGFFADFCFPRAADYRALLRPHSSPPWRQPDQPLQLADHRARGSLIMDRILRTALLRLHGKDAVPASQFTAAQRTALDSFARQTGAVSCQRQGRGDVYRVSDPRLFDTHLAALSPQVAILLAENLPLRAQHIAHARDSKARNHQHSDYYPTLKAVGDKVLWRHAEHGVEFPLGQLTRDFGAASLRIEASDAWFSEQPLWLVENQALFERTDWLPADTPVTLLYYGGQLDGRLVAWLARRPRASRVMLFPDYDGVGLANFARLYALLGDACDCWLMPGWSSKLAGYGSQQLWRDTFREFTSAVTQLPDYLDPLTRQMRQFGLALEQEAVWLPSP